MGAVEVLRTVEDAGGEVWAAGNLLRYRLPESALALVVHLRESKTELLSILRQRHAQWALEAEPEAYEDGLDQWANSRCVYREKGWWNIGALHVDYAVWCEKKGVDVPASRTTFERLLEMQGFRTRDGFCYGLTLKEDIWAIQK